MTQSETAPRDNQRNNRDAARAAIRRLSTFVQLNGAVSLLLIAAACLFLIAIARDTVTWQAITLLALGIGCLLMAFGMLKGVQFEGFGMKFNFSLQEELQQIKAQNLALTNFMEATKPLIEEIAHKVRQLEAGSVSGAAAGATERAAASLTPPPARSRGPYADDIQKDRWGGQSKRDGYALSANFHELKSEDWVRIELTVKSVEPSKVLTGPVTFFLHQSFAEPEITVTSRDGAASLVVTVWGGFTVGAWIHNGGVELELDLSRLSNAPKAIREL